MTYLGRATTDWFNHPVEGTYSYDYIEGDDNQSFTDFDVFPAVKDMLDNRGDPTKRYGLVLLTVQLWGSLRGVQSVVYVADSESSARAHVRRAVRPMMTRWQDGSTFVPPGPPVASCHT